MNSMSQIMHKEKNNVNCIGSCFRVPKPFVNPSTQPGGKKKCAISIKNSLGPNSYKSNTRFVQQKINHFLSFEGAPGGYGSSPKNILI